MKLIQKVYELYGVFNDFLSVDRLYFFYYKFYFKGIVLPIVVVYDRLLNRFEYALIVLRSYKSDGK